MQAHAKRVVVAGSMNVDTILRVRHLPEPGQTLLSDGVRFEPGGKSSNQAAAAALLGADVALFGVIGEDSQGQMLVARAEALGVDTHGVRRDSTLPTGNAIVMVDDLGENSIVVASGANQRLRADLIDDAIFEAGAVVVLALESPADEVTLIAERARAHGCDVLLNASPASAVPNRLLHATTILVVNSGEAEQIAEVDLVAEGWQKLQSAFRSRGVQRVVVTLGARGAAVLDEDGIEEIPSFAVQATDTTGCGDAFMGAVAAEVAAGRSLRRAARTGIAAGAWAAQSVGAQSSYGTRADLASLEAAGSPAA